MKYSYSILLIAFLVGARSFSCSAQWIPVYQDNTAAFYDAAFPTNHTGYVAASDTGGAVVLRTTDGGITWNKRYIPGLDFLSKVVMLDSMHGYLIKGGDPTWILRTKDGFATLSAHHLDSCFTVQALCMLNDSTGFYLNNGSRLRRFEHYGAAYFHVIDTLAGGQNLQFVNPHTGYLDTGNGLLMTPDAGVTWNPVNANLGFFCVVFNFADSSGGYFSDGTHIYKTNDGAASFPQQFAFPNVFSFSVHGNFCMAANDTGAVAYTTDGGLSWQTETTGLSLLAPEPCEVVSSPGGVDFIFSEQSKEIRKRQAVISGISSTTTRDPGICLYPNPCQDRLVVSNAGWESAEVRLYDITARMVLDQKFTNSVTLNMAPLLPGVYLLEVSDKNGLMKTGEVVKD